MLTTATVIHNGPLVLYFHKAAKILYLIIHV